ncbi:hypothetical protein I546_5327 [Mycobacterium kansasii 732]|uniref:Putative membrane protein ArfB n=1 Tax=Mycobacterium pseudokansasii TaxID=2341080 RepID=A0A498R0I1_9MYCO|nr:hypothetical protein [Mycobacterium pseudokansasii]EUA07469.1 hypothetical protein I546_5327 [Mycobacterium kansasii 732]MBY0389377.1 hypothetical protein [Mycobacterium pseudokansasii]VBA30560.1 putative membrane protein ArfB [Mycobacterium pseudokansasii]VBA32372.1 putative membrane protein ArfB [Mycobacterium pseudokansasii]VBA54477.1 putative membrane protein ArfB [Mycobacterium pseudokansasii]
MDFVIQWLYYLAAFVAGSALAWVIATAFVKPAGQEQQEQQLHEAQETEAAP